MSNTNCIVGVLQKLTYTVYVDPENLWAIAVVPDGTITLRSVVAALEWVRGFFSSAQVIYILYNNGKSDKNCT